MPENTHTQRESGVQGGVFKAPSGAVQARALEPSRLALVDIFRNLPQEALASLAAGAQIFSLAPGDPVPSADLVGEQYLCVVLQGSVGVYRRTGSSGKVLVAQIEHGGSFGEFAILCGDRGVAELEAIRHSEIAGIPAGAFLTLLHKHPAVSIDLLRKLVGVVRDLDARLAKSAGLDQMAAPLLGILLRSTL